MKNNFKYYIAYKPYGMLNQFTDKEGRKTLSSLYKFPKDVYAVGRLDMDSEGLVLLTNDKKLTNILLNPKYAHEREYLVQVEGIPTKEAIEKLCKGVIIENKLTLPAKVKLVEAPKDLPERIPPIRERKNIPTSWLSVSLIEGRNRQVRKMTASVGFPTLRLIRVRIGKIQISNLKISEVRQLSIKSIDQIL